MIPPQVDPADVFWLGTIGGLVAFDVYMSRRNPKWTLSNRSRRFFAVHTRPGQMAFIGGWALLTGWLLPHIVMPRVAELVEPLDDWTPEGT